jgi:hypothetical protein
MNKELQSELAAMVGINLQIFMKETFVNIQNRMVALSLEKKQNELMLQGIPKEF